jgi:hypothetical protein
MDYLPSSVLFALPGDRNQKSAKCSFTNLQKCEPKPLDIIQELWHNTVVAKKTGKQLLVSKPPEKGFPEEKHAPRATFPLRDIWFLEFCICLYRR